MGRFLNPKALKSPPKSFNPSPASGSVIAAPEPGLSAGTGRSGTALVKPLGSAQTAAPDPQLLVAPTVSSSVLLSLGTYSLFFFFISPELNDLSQHFFHVNLYVSWLSQGLLALAFFTSGTAGQGLRLPLGKVWFVLTCLMATTVLFSTWRAESLNMMMNYIPRCVLFFFALCAFVVDEASVRVVITAEVVKGFLILLICVVMGSDVEGRFGIPDSSFYAGANDLALGLSINAAFFFYWVVQKSFVKVLLGSAGFVGAMYYLIKTSSRGAFIGTAAMLVCMVLFSAKFRWRLLPIIICSPLLLLVVPNDMLHRLTHVALNSKNAVATTEAEAASLESQREREELFRRSVELMMTHPLFGVGVGEFADAIMIDDKEKNQRSATLGTHNSYTQVGSECGIPALIAYIALLVMSIRLSYKVFRRSNTDPRFVGLTTAALSVFATLIGYSVGTFFYHVAYGGAFPLLTGASAGLWQAFVAEVKQLPDADPALLE